MDDVGRTRLYRLLALGVCLLTLCVGLAVVAGPAAADGVTPDNSTVSDAVVENDTADPESDQLGWENGLWANATLSITQSDGINESELEAVVARTMARVEAVRGIEFDRTPPVRILLPREQRAESEQLRYSDPQRTRLNATYEALFLINESQDAVASQQALRGNGVNGYYSPSTGNVTMVSPNSTVRQIREGVLAQELFHAQQDNQFDLPAVRTIEQRNARNGYVEGDANYVQDRYEQRCGENWTCYRPERQSVPDLSGVNDGMLTLFGQPYQSGYAFVRDRHQQSGWDAVNKLYENPPESTEQIIHPDKYREDSPTAVQIRDRSSAAWQPLTVNGDRLTQSVGEAGLYVSLLSPARETTGQTAIISFDNHFVGGFGDAVTENYAHPATAGWDGDRLLPYTAADGNATGYVYETAWDSPEDAREFYDAYRKLLAYHEAEPVAGLSNTYRVPDSSGFADALYVNRTGSRLRIVNAPSTDALSEIRQGAAPEGSTADGQWKHILWKSGLDGNRLIQPVAENGTVFAYDGSQMYGFDRDAGEAIWTQQVNESIVSAPVVADGAVYAGSFDSAVLAFDGATGEREWTRQVDAPIVAAPAVADKTAYVATTGGSLYALNATTGEPRWTTQLNGTSQSLRVAGDTVLVGNATALAGVDAPTGEIEWTVTFSGRIVASPRVLNQTVYTTSFDRSVGNSYLHAVDASSGDNRWTQELNGSGVAQTTVTDETVYLGGYNTSNRTGQVFAFDRESGEQRWTVESEKLITGMAAANDSLYVGTTAGTVRAITASTGNILWETQAESPINRRLVALNGTLYVGTQGGTLTALEMGTGSKQWQLFADRLASISPTLVDGGVYATGGDLYAIDASQSTAEGSGDATGEGGTNKTTDADNEPPSDDTADNQTESESAATTETLQDTPAASEDGPGFGVAVALVAIGLVAVVRR
ncbi:Hvo_1808 family surface protein [Halovenus salina]|uniref:Hvo_1808 family surface protein n=1 Tax=Halovenus salina TaxID=1510225 RepID=A0ABD5W674_9EURY|nr:Hvo_1808 family surface protein [Halovenus salina]